MFTFEHSTVGFKKASNLEFHSGRIYICLLFEKSKTTKRGLCWRWGLRDESYSRGRRRSCSSLPSGRGRFRCRGRRCAVDVVVVVVLVLIVIAVCVIVLVHNRCRRNCRCQGTT